MDICVLPYRQPQTKPSGIYTPQHTYSDPQNTASVSSKDNAVYKIKKLESKPLHFMLGERTYTFRTPMRFTIEQCEGVLIECLDYDVYGHGDTLEEAQECLEEAFAMLYKEYALEEDALLTIGAQNLKKRLLEEVTHGEF